MMELKVSEWKEFRITKLFSISAGKYYSSDDYGIGKTPYVSASASNNGVIAHIDKSPDFEGNQIVTGKVESKAFYQKFPFCATSDANVFTPLFAMSESVGLFFATILSFNEQGKWGYGRQCRIGDSEKIILCLPVQHDASGQPVIDPRKKYSDDGYVPDWDFMEQYMKSLNHPSLTTNRGYKYPTLGVDKWKEFQVGRLFQLNIARSVDYGNTTEGNTIFVGRTSENNGVQGYVSETPVEDGNCIIIGMVGSNLAFYQDKPFAASQNILVLRNDMLNRSIAMFLCTVLSKCVEIYRDTYSLPLGKEKIKSRGIKLPVQHDASGQPLIDPLKKYSDDGYIPDWAFMEQYIESLPGSDLLK